MQERNLGHAITQHKKDNFISVVMALVIILSLSPRFISTDIGLMTVVVSLQLCGDICDVIVLSTHIHADSMGKIILTCPALLVICFERLI